MAICHEGEIPVVVIPASVAGIFFGLDMVGPVDLNKRNIAFDQAPGQQAGLAETCVAIGRACLWPLGCQIESLQRGWARK